MDSELTETHVQAVKNAAECWNMEFGTDLRVSRDEGAPQPISVGLSDFVCGYASGSASSVGQLQLHICSTLDTGRKIFSVVRHEIGHTLGIWTHADDQWAVMGPGGGAEHNTLFRPADHALFEAANADFEPIRRRCDLIYQLGTTQRRPMLVRDGAAGFYLFHVIKDAVVVSRVSKNWQVAEVARVATKGLVSFIRAAPTPEGAVISWVRNKAIYFASISLREGMVGATRQIVLTKGSFTSEMGMSTARVAPHLYIAVTANLSSTYLYQVDEATGVVRREGIAPRADGKIVAHGNQVYLVSTFHDDKTTLRSLRVERLDLKASDAAIGLADRVVLNADLKLPFSGVRMFDAAATSSGILVTLDTVEEPDVSLRLFQLQPKAAPALSLVRTKDLPKIGSEANMGTFTDVLEQGMDLYVASDSLTGELYSRETHLIHLDAKSLAVKTGWRRLSAPDIARSVQPLLARASDQLMVVWRDWYDGGSSRGDATPIEHDIKGRCISQQ